MPLRKPAAATAASAEPAPAPMQIRDRPLNALQDLIDLRDHYYQPSLQTLRRRLAPEPNLVILDQQNEGACTGFALAAAIELFKRHRLRREQLEDASAAETFPPLSGASPRMLYEMAKLHDEIQEPNQSGSTLRGVLKGFFHNGVCSEGSAPYEPNPPEPWTLTIQSARDARTITLGAYYRLRPAMSDYHAALNETGAVVISAQVHEGWRAPNMLAEFQPVAEQKDGVIKKIEGSIGGHAFVAVGYDENGFLVQNSWGTGWGGYGGRPGIAHWCYEDWAENIMDAWVLQLGVPTPTAFHLTHTLVRSNYLAAQAGTTASQARRQDVLGQSHPPGRR